MKLVVEDDEEVDDARGAEQSGYADQGPYTAIISRYARLRANGKPMKCSASPQAKRECERQGRTVVSNLKIIYDSRRLAELAGREMASVDGRRRRAYPCERSRHGHHHLTTTGSGRKRDVCSDSQVDS